MKSEILIFPLFLEFLSPPILDTTNHSCLLDYLLYLCIQNQIQTKLYLPHLDQACFLDTKKMCRFLITPMDKGKEISHCREIWYLEKDCILYFKKNCIFMLDVSVNYILTLVIFAVTVMMIASYCIKRASQKFNRFAKLSKPRQSQLIR